MAKEKKQKVAESGKSQKISFQLISILVPMIAVFIVAVALIIFITSRGIITTSGKDALKNESQSNANSIATSVASIQNYYNGLGDLIENSDMTGEGAIMKALQPGMNKFPEKVIDVYIAFSDLTFYDGGGWVPEAGYDPTDRAWYINGSKTETMIFGPPSVDMTTGKMVVCGSRAINTLDGRTGVISTDIVLSGLSEQVAAYTPSGTGKSMLFSGSTIVASPEADEVGKDVSEFADNSFLQALYGEASKASETVDVVKGNDGANYFVSCDAIAGTDWILVSYVKQNDVLSELNTLSYITVILVILMLIASTVILIILIKFKITNPVTALTDNIVRIADGDFSVDIKKGGNNEIGIMNNRMHDYVERMRETLGEMRSVTNLLSSEADNSRNASNTLNIQAEEQSNSMEQIHEAMEGVAQSVTELATNATELAQSVGDMTDQGNATNETMMELLGKAKQGQKDMDNVQRNMDSISTTMSEMSEVVGRVADATQQINSIIDMINSISSQTNLLSLNASIEAARAGEAGRGFAVVADEIGALAAESAKATTEIAEIITEVTKQINDLSERSANSVNEIAVSSEAVSATGETFADIFAALDEAGSTVRDMIEKMQKVNDIATSVAAIAEEQSASTEEVTATVDTAATSAQNVASESKGVDDSAVAVADSATKIGDFVNTFKIE